MATRFRPRRPTDRPTDRPLTDRTGRPTDRPTDRPTNRPTNRPPNRPTGRPGCVWSRATRVAQVLLHPLWGAAVYPATLFTTAPFAAVEASLLRHSGYSASSASSASSAEARGQKY